MSNTPGKPPSAKTTLLTILLFPVMLGVLLAICALVSLGVVALLGGSREEAEGLTGVLVLLTWLALPSSDKAS